MSNGKLLWIPRILAIAYILFLSLFSLDVFSSDGTFAKQIGSFIMHNIPSLLLAVILIVNWKRPLAAGLMFIAAGVVFTVFFRTYGNIYSFLSISVSLFVTGGLYVLAEQLQKKKSRAAG